MKKMLFIRGNYPINPRTQKSYEALSEDYAVKFIYWDRKKIINNEEETGFYYYQSKNKINSRVKKAFSIFGFYKYLKRVMREYEPDIIYAYHWDMFILSQLTNTGKNTKTIYDVTDMPDYNGIIFSIFKRIEELFIKRNVYLILASKYFEKFYSRFSNPKVVIDNKPKSMMTREVDVSYKSPGEFNIIYVGSIKYKEILKNLVNSIKDLNVNLLFFGGGFDEEFMRNYCKGMSNVYFYGSYTMDEINSFYKLGDVAWAAYPSKSINVKYATSNKFFESIMNGVPCIFSEDTALGRDVKNQRIGFTVDPYNPNAIRTLIQDILTSNILEKTKENISKINVKDLIWENEAKKLQRFVREIDGGTENN